MEQNQSQDRVLAKLLAWAERQPSLRALILSSSRANPAALTDPFSDYDIILVVPDVAAYTGDDNWIAGYGAPVVTFHDQDHIDGFPERTRLVLYEDDTKIDYVVWSVGFLRHIADAAQLPENLDVGYRVLLDKDGLTAHMPQPTYTAHIPAQPTTTEYQQVIEEFWWESIYVAKNLWRDEIVQAKYNLDQVMKFELLRKVFEWRIELDHAWKWKPGAYGRGLKRALPAELWTAFAATYVGPEVADTWNALFKTVALFRQVAQEVGQALGYAYPIDMDERVMAYLQRVASQRHQAYHES